MLGRGLGCDRHHHTHNELSAVSAGKSEIRTLSAPTLGAGADLRVIRAGFAVMPKRSFNICLVIFVLDDLVDGFFDSVKVILVLEGERLILNIVNVQQQTRSAISTWMQGR